MTDHLTLLRQLPSVDRVLATDAGAAAAERFAHAHVVQTIRLVLDELRARISAGAIDVVWGADDIAALLPNRLDPPMRLRPVINATGVILHTNLGRACLADEAVDAVANIAAQASNLEYDLADGARGERDDLVCADLCALTGAEAALVVNNNAAALLLALNTCAEGREVIVSRGELIEIGGSFRLPDLMAKSQAILREVGTTNRTHQRDYEAALGDRSAALLKVHTSNYRIVGFTHEVPLSQLVEIGRKHGLPVIEDLGSGALIDLSAHGLPKEPVVSERVQMGADLVCFSGDKLLGGPQAGVVVGRRALIERLQRNPLKRALRCDKLTLAALAATLRLYRTAPDLGAVLPTLRFVKRSMAEIEAVGQAALVALRSHLGSSYRVDLIDTQAEFGSGALPTATLMSRALAISHTNDGPDKIAAQFRAADPPIIGRVHDGNFLLDLRMIYEADDLIPRVVPRT